MKSYKEFFRRVLARIKCKNKRGQGSIEYLLMLSAVSIVIVIALAMIVQLKGDAVSIFYNSTNGSISSQIGAEISKISLNK